MRAVAVFPADKKISVIDNVPEPQLRTATDVKVKVLEVGVCGTDRDICAFNYGQPPQGSDYLIAGHEILAQVIAIGNAVSRVKVSDLVYIMVRRPCGDLSCLPCQLNHQDFCVTGKYTERGIKEAHGYLTEFVVDDEKFMAPLPPQLRDVGVLVDPLTIATKALEELEHLQSRLPQQMRHQDSENPIGIKHRALIIGAGPVGLVGAMATVKRGYETFVYSAGTTPEKQSLVEAFGATYIAAETCPVEQLVQQATKVNFIYGAAGAPSVAFSLTPMLDNNGVMAVTGLPGHKYAATLDVGEMMRKMVLSNQVIFGSVNASIENCEQAIADLNAFYQSWPKAVKNLITGRFAMEDYVKLASGPSVGIKNIIQIA